MEIIYKTNYNLENAKAFLFGLKNLSTYENEISLEDLKKYKDKKIFLAIDKNMFNKDLSYLEKILSKIDNYNIEGILFYDLAVLSISKRLNIKTPLIWSQNFLVTNYKTCNYYEKENVKGAVLSSEITISEIEEICKNTNFDIFVNIFGFQPMAFSKRHLLTNYFEYINEENENTNHYMKERGKSYRVEEGRCGTKFYSNEILNGIKYINRLKNSGVKYVIMDSNTIDEDTFKKVSNIYEKALSDLSDEKLLKYEDEISKLLPNSSTLFLDKKTIYKVKKK